MAVLFLQFRLSFGEDCLKENTALLAHSLIELKGKDFVSNLLNDDIRFLIFYNVDSSGYVISIRKISIRKENNLKNSLSEDFFKEVECYLKTNKIRFFICYYIDGEEERKMYKLIVEDWKKEKKDIHPIGIGFPGLLMKWYEYEKKEDGLQLSKFEYLEKQISLYINKTVN